MDEIFRITKEVSKKMVFKLDDLYSWTYIHTHSNSNIKLVVPKMNMYNNQRQKGEKQRCVSS